LSHPHPELTTPPPLPPNGVRVVALGGLGEVGRNMTVIEHAGRLLVVDCGVLFPEDHHPGVDLILPDFEYIADRLDDIDAIVLTHGHEDHIGAVPRAGQQLRGLQVSAQQRHLVVTGGQQRLADRP
jgi:ribonuclease J